MSTRKPKRWKVVERFADEMQRRLNANSWKGGAGGLGWNGDSFRDLWGRLEEEARELDVAWRNERPEAEIRKEAADVANFAMMIADNWGNLRGKR